MEKLKITSLKLNKKNNKIYLTLNLLALFIFLIFLIFISYKIIFPSQYFTYSFKNTNSLKNTISDIKEAPNELEFFSSTPFNFSDIIITVKTKNEPISIFNIPKIRIKKSYKSFFYPESNSLENLSPDQENILSSIDNSVYIVGQNKKTPVDSTETFEALGYDWKNVSENKNDLGGFEKQKLADMNYAHPNGTVFETIENNEFYFIENNTKRKIEEINPPVKNPIRVSDQSLKLQKSCTLMKSFKFSSNYRCGVEISDFKELVGKDYKFNLTGLSSKDIEAITIEFKKSPSLDNFKLFLFELKKKILYRFGIKDF